MSFKCIWNITEKRNYYISIHTFRLAAIWQYPLRLKLLTSSNSAPTYVPPETLQHVRHEGLLEHSQYLNIFVGNCVTVKSTKISVCIRVNNALWYIWTMDYIAFGMNELNYIHQYICCMCVYIYMHMKEKYFLQLLLHQQMRHCTFMPFLPKVQINKIAL